MRSLLEQNHAINEQHVLRGKLRRLKCQDHYLTKYVFLLVLRRKEKVGGEEEKKKETEEEVSGILFGNTTNNCTPKAKI